MMTLFAVKNIDCLLSDDADDIEDADAENDTDDPDTEDPRPVDAEAVDWRKGCDNFWI